MATDSTLTFSSISRSGIAYRFHGNSEHLWSAAYRTAGMPLGPECGEYQTFGDGMTQHGPEFPVVAVNFADYCASLGAHLQVLLRGDRRELSDDQIEALMWRNPARPRYSDEAIRFALTVVYKQQDGKRQYFNARDCKLRTVSASKDTLQYDKRWARVHERMDGSVDSAVYVLTRREDDEHAHLYLLERYALASKVIKVAGDKFSRNDAGRHCLLVDKDSAWSPEAHQTLRKLDDAFEVLARGFAVIDALYNLRRGVEVWMNNLENDKRRAEEAQRAEQVEVEVPALPAKGEG